MLDKLRKKPLWTSLLVFILYLTWFLVPHLIVKLKGGVQADGWAVMNETEFVASQIGNQIWLIVGLTAIVAILVWWRQVGFTHHIKGSLKFTLLPLLVSAVFFTMGVSLHKSGGSLNIFGADNLKLTVQFLLASLMVGYTEELMFRGILQHGMIARFKPVLGVIITALVFGSMHFVNMLGGQGLGETTGQVVHAASDGFMYGSIRLITGSIWPVMVLHGLWDMAISVLHTQIATQGGEIAQGLTDLKIASGVSISPTQILPGLLYGSFVLWRWVVRSKKEEQTTIKGKQ